MVCRLILKTWRIVLRDTSCSVLRHVDFEAKNPKLICNLSQDMETLLWDINLKFDIWYLSLNLSPNFEINSCNPVNWWSWNPWVNKCMHMNYFDDWIECICILVVKLFSDIMWHHTFGSTIETSVMCYDLNLSKSTIGSLQARDMLFYSTPSLVSLFTMPK